MTDISKIEDQVAVIKSILSGERLGADVYNRLLATVERIEAELKNESTTVAVAVEKEVTLVKQTIVHAVASAKYALARFTEASSWAGISAALASLATQCPETIQTKVAFASGLCGFIAYIVKDKSNAGTSGK